MGAPLEFQMAFMQELAKALAPAIDRAWEAGQRAIRTGVIVPKTVGNSRQESTLPRLRRGKARTAVLMAVRAYRDTGATRDQLRRMIPNFNDGQAMSESTLKRVLMVLRQRGDIETRNSRWYPMK